MGWTEPQRDHRVEDIFIYLLSKDCKRFDADYANSIVHKDH